jgi:hypothetical protein
MKRFFLLAFFLAGPFCRFAGAATPMLKHEPEVPPRLAFVRTFDVDAFVERINERRGRGAESLRLRTRYLDPDVNLFVGLVTGLHHFNQDLYIGDPEAPDTAGTFWNWGINMGMVRGRHLWEFDLMGVVLSSSLGPAAAIVGEHAMGAHWTLYHRIELNLLPGDTLFDGDLGAAYMWNQVGLSAGYRIFAAQHMSRSGPHVGIRLLFESPKIPFLFPSLG